MVTVEGIDTVHGAISKHDLDYADRFGESILPEVVKLSPIGKASVHVYIWYDHFRHPFIDCTVNIGLRDDLNGSEYFMSPYADDLRDRLMQHLLAKNYPKP